MRPLNLEGQVFGSWTVITQVPSRNGKRYWRCKCACGNEGDVQTAVLRQGKSRSCGCFYRGSNRADWKGAGELSGMRWAQLLANARQRNIPTVMSIHEAWQVFTRQSGACALTGLPLSFDRGDQTASLDRIDNSKGYEVGNVHWVHKDVNLMKNKLDIDYFKHLCKLIAVNT